TAQAVGKHMHKAQCKANPCIDRARIDVQRLPKAVLSFAKCLCRFRPVVRGPAAHEEIACLGVNRALLLDATGGYLDQLQVEGSCEPAGNLVLSVCQIDAIGIEPFGPKVRCCCCIDKLDVDPYLLARAPHAALDHIIDVQVAADPLHIDRFSL